MFHNKDVIRHQLATAKASIAKARQDNDVTTDVGDALLSLLTAVEAIAKTLDEDKGPHERYGQSVR